MHCWIHREMEDFAAVWPFLEPSGSTKSSSSYVQVIPDGTNHIQSVQNFVLCHLSMWWSTIYWLCNEVYILKSQCCGPSHLQMSSTPKIGGTPSLWRGILPWLKELWGAWFLVKLGLRFGPGAQDLRLMQGIHLGSGRNGWSLNHRFYLLFKQLKSTLAHSHFLHIIIQSRTIQMFLLKK